MKGYAKETEAGKTLYEVERMEGSTHRDLSYVGDGSIATVGETLPVADLPAAVQATVKANYAKAKIVRAEK